MRKLSKAEQHWTQCNLQALDQKITYYGIYGPASAYYSKYKNFPTRKNICINCLSRKQPYRLVYITYSFKPPNKNRGGGNFTVTLCSKKCLTMLLFKYNLA